VLKVVDLEVVVVYMYMYTRHTASVIRDSSTARAFKCKTGRLDGDI